MYATTTCTIIDASTTQCVTPVAISYGDFMFVSGVIIFWLAILGWPRLKPYIKS